jgi:signal transduction histidine kinase
MWLEGAARPLLRTSGFRLALRSLALSLGGAVLVFLIIHHAAETIWREQIDATVGGALTDILSDVQRNREGLAQNVRDTMAEGGGLFFADIGPDGNLRAGNFNVSPAVLARWTGSHTFRRGQGLVLPPRVLAVRGIAQKFPDGETLLIAQNASPLLATNALISRSFVAVFGTILALGLLSGYLAARTESRRVEAIATTLREIMNGDLSRRVPVGQAGDEFDRLAAGLNAMLQRLQELMENLRQVTTDIAHDLRSPLARLREHLELSRRRFTGPGLPRMFDEALLQIDQALDIFAAMLRIAEVEAGARRSHFARVDITTLLHNLAETFETVAEAEGRTFRADIAPELEILGDSELLIQMFVNVIENAIRHTPFAGLVSLRAERDKSRDILVVIADHGPGIPAHERRRVMQRFVRLDASRHNPGAGLGLALVAAIVELHSGQISLEDNAPGLSVLIKLGLEA